MAAVEQKKLLVDHLVADSAAFIRNVRLHEIGEKIYTTESVVHEIKDKSSIHGLQNLPFGLILREPSPESIKLVTDFSKKTGDYPCLSPIDIRVVALTCDLHRQFVGPETLKTEPCIKVKLHRETRSNGIGLLPGFYVPTKKTTIESDKNGSENGDGTMETGSSDEKDEGEDDESGWIDTENLESVMKDMGLMTVDDKPTNVACLTMDFAMQNTLIQMGMRVMSIEGKLISHAKTFILRCYGCFKTTSIMTTRFCPHCGNKTLKRVSVSVTDDGTTELNLNFRKPINTRGIKYSLPRPKGGKHAVNPIVCADQPIPQNKQSSIARRKFNALDPDFIAGSSPFPLNDVYSKSAILGISGRENRFDRWNPNNRRKRTGNRK